MGKVQFDGDAWEQYLDWARVNQKILKKINHLITEASRTPFSGTGKPEPLTGNRSGLWSRRINDEHRLIYRMKDGILVVYSCMGHYED